MSHLLHPLFTTQSSVNQRLNFNFAQGIQVDLKREDLLHPANASSSISGNKFRKLKYNLEAAQQAGQHTLLTFGGAYSNHIAAVAAAGQALDFQTIGLIRGDELAYCWQDNPTLNQAAQHGMQFKFLSRADYRRKNTAEFIEQLKQQLGDFYLLPEGGTNPLAIKGCMEILTQADREQYDYVCCAVGTGGTLAGIIESSAACQQVLGFAALKGNFLASEIRQWTTKTNWQIMEKYHCGGYAKTTPELMQFIQNFEQQTQIKIEPIYTGKMLFGLFDLIQQGYFPAHSRILAIHTGGLQGNLEMANRST